MIFISITTYGLVNNVIDQIENIYSKENEYWVHYNKREKIKNFKILKKYFIKYDNVKIFSKYKVYWGHYSILKSCIYMQKQFLKSDKEIFIHLDAKTCNVISPEELNSYLVEKNNHGYNFMRSAKKNIFIGFNYSLIINNKNETDWPFTRKWYYLTSSNNSKFYFFYILFLCYIKSIWNIKNFYSLNKLIILRILHKINNSYFNKFFNFYLNKYFYPARDITFIFKKNKRKISKILKEFNFFYNSRRGGGLVINKKDLELLHSSIFFKELFKFSKKMYAPEEWFFDSLYWNIKKPKEDKSLNLFFYLSNFPGENMKNKDNVVNLNNEKICFLRRLEGKNQIEIAKKILFN